jgi:hypothetical protein
MKHSNMLSLRKRYSSFTGGGAYLTIPIPSKLLQRKYQLLAALTHLQTNIFMNF